MSHLMSLGAGAGLGAGLWNAGLPAAPAAALGLCLALGGELWHERRARARALADLSGDNRRLQAQTDALVAQLAEMKDQLGRMARTFEIAAAQRDARLVKEMKVIESLVGRLAAGVNREREATPVAAMPPPLLAAKDAAKPAIAETAVNPPAPPQAPATREALSELSEMELLEVIRSALEDNRIDLYLQPVVSLPQRKTLYYEGLARLRSLDGDIIEPEQFIAVAERAGLMPIVDNLLLFRCVQFVRRLLIRHTKRPIFCNMSGHSLADPDFFPQFLEFITENKSLSDSLIFEFSQETIHRCGPEAETNLKALQDLGFQFSLDHVTDFKLDYSWLRRHNFKYLKVDAGELTRPHEEAPPEIAIDNLVTLLERQSISLVVEKIEDEDTVLGVLDYDIPLGQGFLFGPPRPIKRGFLDDPDEASDAA